MIYCNVDGSHQGKCHVDDSGLSLLLAPYAPMSFDVFQSHSCLIISFAFFLPKQSLGPQLIIRYQKRGRPRGMTTCKDNIEKDTNIQEQQILYFYVLEKHINLTQNASFKDLLITAAFVSKSKANASENGNYFWVYMVILAFL